MEQIIYQGSDGCIHCLGDTYLVHYNHNHDKLGRFASSTGSAGSSQRGLRKLERHRVVTLGKEMKADYKMRKSMSKTQNTIKKFDSYKSKHGEPSKRLAKKMTKQLSKTEKYKNKANEYESNRKETEDFINKAIKNAEKNGYVVSFKNTTQSSRRGKDFINMYLGAELAGPIGAVVAVNAKNNSQYRKYGPQYSNQTPSRISSKKYKTKKKK